MTEDRALPESGAPYPVRTTRRRGRMSAAKRDALIDLLPKWSIADPLTAPLTESALRDAFGRSAPRLLDVGVGTGEATIAWARDHPDHDVVAVELHRPGIARMVQVLEADGPTNVRMVETDVTRLLDVLTGASAPVAPLLDAPVARVPIDGMALDGVAVDGVAVDGVAHDPLLDAPSGAPLVAPAMDGMAVGSVASLDPPLIEAVRVLFPDPWPKTRHRSRRLVDRTFVHAVADLLPIGGSLHLATDWDGYALQMVQAVLAEPRFEIDADPTALAAVAALVERTADATGAGVVSRDLADERTSDSKHRSGSVDRSPNAPPVDATAVEPEQGSPIGASTVDHPHDSALDAAVVESALENIEGPLPWASPRPPRPITTYERRGLQAGRRVTDLVARRVRAD